MIRGNMNDLVRLFTDIVLHRRGPADVPASGSVLGGSLAAYLVAGALALAPGAGGPGAVLGQLLVDLGIVVVLFGGLLYFTGRGHRLRQTLCALFGAGALLSALSVPFIWIASGAADPAVAADPGPAVVFSSLMLLVLLVASLLVTGHIVRCAMDWPYPAGVLVALVYFGISLEVFRRVFPETA